MTKLLVLKTLFLSLVFLLNPIFATGAEIHGDTPLMQAAYRADLAVMRKLLSAGADPNEQNFVGNTALSFATGATPVTAQVYSGSTEAVELLIEKHADVNLSGKMGYTPLMYAVMHENLKSVRTLINHGAKVNAQTKSGDTALFNALYRGNIEIVAELLKHGAEVNGPKDVNGSTPLLVAVTYITNPALPLTEEQLRKYDDTLVAKAIELLRKSGFAPKEFDDKKKSREFLAKATVLSQGLEIMDLLLKQNAAVNVTDKQGRTPLTLAATNSHALVAEKLLERGADPEAKDKAMGNATALLLAVRANNLPLTKMLLKKKANRNVKDSFNKGVLDFAKINNDPAMLDLLREYGVSTNTTPGK